MTLKIQTKSGSSEWFHPYLCSWNDACGAAKPNIDKAVALLQQFELGAQIKFANAKKPNSRAPPQAPDIIRREAEFRKLRELYQAGKVTLKVYTDEIRDIHRFEPKRKYVEDLVDTDESDDDDAIDDGTDTSDEEWTLFW